jgi:hypothetical protein
MLVPTRTWTIPFAVLLSIPGYAFAGTAPATAPRPSGSVEHKEFDARAAHLEIGSRLPAILAVLAARPGETAASFGLTHPEFLESLLRELGPQGRAISIHRSYTSYQTEIESAARWGGRVESIFAADGDAHLEPLSATLVVAQEVDGFYLREEDLWRQAWNALQPEGRLVLIRYPPTPPRNGPTPPKATPPKPSPSGFAERLASNRAAVEMERSGFRLVESPKVLIHWVVEVYRRIDLPPTPTPGGVPGSSAP